MIEVWAPDVERVEIQLGAPGETLTREPMVRDAQGWWRWEGDPTAYAELDYAFLVDGQEPALPDPRSAWQPHGVDGPSRLFDTSVHEWADTGWRGPRDGAGTLGGVVYELHVGTFTDEGTFNAAIDRLGHLVDLGVDVVEVLPVAAIPGRWGWGYDGVDLYAVHDPLGGPAGFQRFVDACHARGLGVCLDVVYNHLGPSGNYLGRFGPYFTESHMTPWGPAVNLDAPGSEVVRSFIIDNALRWLRDFHVDALRLDAVHALVDEGERHLLVELSDAVADLSEQLGRPLDLIAESDLNDTSMVTPTSEGGMGMTAQWADDVHHGLHVVLTGETQGYYEDFAGGTRAMPGGGPLDVLAKVLTRGFFHDGTWSSFRGHEWGRPVDVDRLDGRRLVTYLQTHDQVGNRATGDRIGSALTPGRAAIGAALYLLGPGTPMIFMGEEWAASSPWQFFTDFTDEGMAEAVRAGRRAEFGGHGWAEDQVPDPQARSTRDASVLRWDDLSAEPHASLLQWYQQLIALRREVLGTGETRFADVTCSIEDDGKRFVMTHRGLTVTAELDADTVTVSAPGRPDLVHP
ncbi:malto-oligosyltrehalose trehalohydrolase [Knoellia sp. CPCC 206435]|uniref:malto-oligosyltrehalose trehalohydrolase n=1 Tax=Knoellia terrae TaxID=3404797 RepID=UPI003B435C0F